MADDIKPRIRVQSTAKKGEVIEVKTLITHPMENGQRKEAAGKVVPRLIINALAVTYKHDVAREHQGDRRVKLEGPVGEMWITGPEDLERSPLDTELCLERGGDIDLGQDAEALRGQGFANDYFGSFDR